MGRGQPAKSAAGPRVARLAVRIPAATRDRLAAWATLRGGTLNDTVNLAIEWLLDRPPEDKMRSSTVVHWEAWASQVAGTLALEEELADQRIPPDDGPSLQARYTACLLLSAPRDADTPQRASARRTRGAQANSLGRAAGWREVEHRRAAYARVAWWLDEAADAARERAKGLPELLPSGERNPKRARLMALADRWVQERDELRAACD